MSDDWRDQSRAPRYPPFAQPVARPQRTIVVPEGAADPPADDDLPAIERFLDELPSIGDYLADDIEVTAPTGVPVSIGNQEHAAAIAGVETRDALLGGPAQDAEGWAVSNWQSYDWSGVSSLGRPSADRAEADASWGATDWSRSDVGNREARGETAALGGMGSMAASGGPNADEVAAALDGIARRIRSGELPIDQFRGTSPEAAIAAALAALLRMRG